MFNHNNHFHVQGAPPLPPLGSVTVLCPLRRFGALLLDRTSPSGGFLRPLLGSRPRPFGVILQQRRLRHGERPAERAVEVLELVRPSTPCAQVRYRFGLRLHCSIRLGLLNTLAILPYIAPSRSAISMFSTSWPSPNLLDQWPFENLAKCVQSFPSA